MRNFRQYEIWKRGVSLSKEVYRFTMSFPKSEVYGLTSQMRRAAVSIPSNIAEGASRTSEKEFLHFLEISVGSTFELETQLQIAYELELLSEGEFRTLFEQVQAEEKLLNLFLSKLK